MGRDRDEFRPRRRRPRRCEEDEYVPPRRGANPWAIAISIVSVCVTFTCCLGYGFLDRTMRLMKEEEKAKAAQVEAERQRDLSEDDGTDETRANLERIGRAIDDHVDATGFYPQNSFEIRDGKIRPLLSWRVHLLPYLGEEKLYRRFKLDEPWSSPANRRQLFPMPTVYGTSTARFAAGPDRTFIRGFAHPGSMLEGPRKPGEIPAGLKPADVPDGPENTIFLVNASESIEWTRPDELEWSPGRPRPNLDGEFKDRLSFELALFCDGSVKAIKKSASAQTLRALIDRRDGAAIAEDWKHRDVRD